MQRSPNQSHQRTHTTPLRYVVRAAEIIVRPDESIPRIFKIKTETVKRSQGTLSRHLEKLICRLVIPNIQKKCAAQQDSKNWNFDKWLN